MASIVLMCGVCVLATFFFFNYYSRNSIQKNLSNLMELQMKLVCVLAIYYVMDTAVTSR